MMKDIYLVWMLLLEVDVSKGKTVERYDGISVTGILRATQRQT
jgi:hypothetical protein